MASAPARPISARWRVGRVVNGDNPPRFEFSQPVADPEIASDEYERSPFRISAKKPIYFSDRQACPQSLMNIELGPYRDIGDCRQQAMEFGGAILRAAVRVVHRVDQMNLASG